MPESARISVVLPEPEGPSMRRRSPGATERAAAEVIGSPVGRVTERPRAVRAGPVAGEVAMWGVAVRTRSDVWMLSSKPVSRFTMAR